MNKLTTLRRSKLAKTLFYFSVFVFSFITILFSSNQIIVKREIPDNINIVSDKLEYFSKNKDEFNVIFLGSSQTYRHIIPSDFDEFMKAEGYNLKSFNFGLTGLKFPEAQFYLQKILAMQPKNLKWLFLEYLEGLDVNPKNLSTAREIYWHTPQNFLTVSQLIWESDRSLEKKIQLTYQNWVPSTYNFLNSGKGSQSIQSILNPDRKHQKNLSSLGKKKDGYLSLDDETGKGFLERSLNFKKNLERYKKRVNNYKRYVNKSNPKPLTPHAKSLIAEMIESAKRQDIETIFLMSPGLVPRDITKSAYRAGQIQTLFNLDDPNRYPSLYQPEKRFDTEHLNREGAKEFTQFLAREFSSYLKE